MRPTAAVTVTDTEANLPGLAAQPMSATRSRGSEATQPPSVSQPSEMGIGGRCLVAHTGARPYH